MKRHFGILAAVCIVTLAMVAYFAQVIDAQQQSTLQFDALISLEFDDETLVVSADPQDTEVEDEEDTYPAEVEMDFAIETTTGQASGLIRLENLQTSRTTFYNVINGDVELNAAGLVVGILVFLQNREDGSTATEFFASPDGTGIPTSSSPAQFRVKIKHEI